MAWHPMGSILQADRKESSTNAWAFLRVAAWAAEHDAALALVLIRLPGRQVLAIGQLFPLHECLLACRRTTSVLTQHLQLACGAVGNILPVTAQVFMSALAGGPGLLEDVLRNRARDTDQLDHAVYVNGV